MNQVPKVSVLIPTYNYARFLDEAIQSVLNQTFTDFELIIVDNCSTDNTVEVVKKYLLDERVSFYQNPTNIGLVNNWNKCLEYARGEYLKILCADDKFRPQLLERFVAVMDQYPNVSLVSSYTEIFGLRSGIRKPPFSGLVKGGLIRERFIKHKAMNWLYNPSAVIFRKTGLQVGRFNNKIFTRTDKEFYLRLLSIGDCFIIPEPLCLIQSQPNSQTSLSKGKRYQYAFESYGYFVCVKEAAAPDLHTLQPALDHHIRKSAMDCAAIMYALIPTLHKKENRVLFKKAFKITYAEGVFLAPMLRLLKKRYKGKRSEAKQGARTPVQ